MKYISKIKLTVIALLFTVVLAVPSVVSEAKTITIKAKTNKYITTVGSEITASGNAVKINNKKPSKMKKKVKSVSTYYNPESFEYQTKSYFDSSSAYTTYADYELATDYATKYKSSTTYQLRFLKAGTYTIKTESYQKEDLEFYYVSYDSTRGQSVYELRRWNPVEGEYVKISNKRFFWEYDEILGYVYKSEDGKTIYDDSGKGDDYSDYTQVSVKKGVDGEYHKYYAPRNIIKVVRQEKYKVVKTSASAVKSFQLGNAKYSSSASNGAYTYSSSSTVAPFLSGKSGKVKIKMNKNYKLMSIIMMTYDANGNEVYTQVKNNKKVTFGQYPYSYKSSYSTRSDLYKTTRIYVSYKNKHTGDYTKFEVKKDAAGNSYVQSTCYYADTKKTDTYDFITGDYDSREFYKK